MMRHYVDVADEELRAASNRTYARLLRGLSPKVAERYGYVADEEGGQLGGSTQGHGDGEGLEAGAGTSGRAIAGRVVEVGSAPKREAHAAHGERHGPVACQVGFGAVYASFCEK
jgi:hypothetical protein